MSSLASNSESHKKRKKRNVIAVSKDYDIGEEKFVEIDQSFEIDQDDCLVIDELIRIQKDNIQNRGGYAGMFMDRRKLSRLSRANDADQDKRVRHLFLTTNVGRLSFGGHCQLPRCIAQLDALESLDLSYVFNLECLPRWIGNLKNLRELHLPLHDKFREIPDEIWDLPKLELFHYDPSLDSEYFDGNGLFDDSINVSIPPSIGKLTNLKTLFVSLVNFLPEELANLSSTLNELTLARYKVAFLPTCIGRLANLEKLTVGQAPFLRALPESLGNLANLRLLRIDQAPKLRSLPDSIGDLANLKELAIDGLGIKSLPRSIGNLQKLKYLSLTNNCHLNQLPDWLGSLITLEQLHLDGSGITSLPTSICNLQKLTVLYLGRTRNLTQLPDEIGNLVNLEDLGLSNSRIASLPDYKHMKNLTNLRFLRLDGSVLDSELSIQDKLKLTAQFPVLGCLGDIEYHHSRNNLAIENALFFNRARSWVFSAFRTEHGEVSFRPLALLPWILAKKPQAFRVGPDCTYREWDINCTCCDDFQSQPDFLFQFLGMYGPRFLSPGSGESTK